MELIISLQISYETLTFRPVIFQFKQCQRVLSGICIFSIQPIRVTIGKTAFLLSGDSLPKTTECIKFFAIAIHWLCRIHRYSSSDRTTIGIAVFSHHCFGIHIKFQIIIEKWRSHIHTGSKTLKIRSFHNTFLIGIPQWYAIRHMLQSTGNRHIMVMAYSCTINLILPIGIFRA